MSYQFTDTKESDITSSETISIPLKTQGTMACPVQRHQEQYYYQFKDTRTMLLPVQWHYQKYGIFRLHMRQIRFVATEWNSYRPIQKVCPMGLAGSMVHDAHIWQVIWGYVRHLLWKFHENRLIFLYVHQCFLCTFVVKCTITCIMSEKNVLESQNDQTSLPVALTRLDWG
jgi:hypothetical protein